MKVSLDIASIKYNRYDNINPNQYGWKLLSSESIVTLDPKYKNNNDNADAKILNIDLRIKDYVSSSSY